MANQPLIIDFDWELLWTFITASQLLLSVCIDEYILPWAAFPAKITIPKISIRPNFNSHFGKEARNYMPVSEGDYRCFQSMGIVRAEFGKRIAVYAFYSFL